MVQYWVIRQSIRMHGKARNGVLISTRDAILAMLIKSDGFVSGETIGETLGISRAAVAGAVKQLREDGCEIRSVTNRGYRLEQVPDRMNSGMLLAWLDEARMERVLCLDCVDSTNRYLAQMALDGAPDGQIVIADAQTAGRGRLSRAFHSPEKMGVYFSYLMRPSGGRTEDMPASWTSVTSMTAVAVSNAIESVCGIRPQIKWVNDLYMPTAKTGKAKKTAVPFGEKICGILTQMDMEADTGHVRSVIVGIGINVAERKSDFPQDLRGIAGSLYTATGKKVLRAQLAAAVACEMDAMRASLNDPDGTYLARYREASVLPGKAVTLISGETERNGEAIAIEDDFALRVRYEDGTEESLHGGEVSIRMAPARDDGRDLTTSELDRYVEQTRRIRELSSPRISALADEDDYRRQLLENFTSIRLYAKENNRILNRHCYPHLLREEQLDGDMVDVLSDFSRKLFNPTFLTYTDAMLVYRNAKRLLREAEEKDDNVLRVRALNFIIVSTYHLAYMRFSSATTIRYREEGWAAVKSMLGFLEKDRFQQLHAVAKDYILSHAAYYLRLFHVVLFDDRSVNPERKSFILQSMAEVLQWLNDPFYLEQVTEDFDRELHCLSALEHIASLTDDNNAAGFGKEDLEKIHAYTEEFENAYRKFNRITPYTEAAGLELPLYRCRNAYLAGKTDEDTYKRALQEIFDSFEGRDFTEDMPTVIMNTAREYLLLLTGKPVGAQDAAFLARVYSRFVDYMHRAPKDNLFGYLIADASTILALFIDVPGGIGFEEMCLSTIAALHPPTYIHTRSVAAFAACLTRHLIKREPSLFLGICGCKDEKQVKKRASEIEDFVYHAALCHDFGKLLVAETIMNYGRDLMDEEMEMIVFHPEAGARLLKKHADTAPYADVALGHHRWYNNRGGYPGSFDIDASPIKNVIAIVTCADCLDAATDAVGRSYKEGKSLDRFLEELREESGERYAPWLYPLFEDGKIRREIETLLTEGRDENYRETYRILRSHRPK